jgi:hypothetical protein
MSVSLTSTNVAPGRMERLNPAIVPAAASVCDALEFRDTMAPCR